MSVMNYVSSEIKIIAVKHSLVGTESLNQSAARFGVSRSTLQKWLLNYEMFGTEGLCHRAGNHHYSKEIKREAVEAYLSGRMSEEEICKKYQIRSRTQLEKWVSLYNGQKEFRPAGGARKGTCMARISGEEKEKAVEFCIAHDRDYALTAERFGFTYQQIYGWVRKYHAAGLNSLREDRECSRELSDWVIENKHLKAVNLELEMEAVLHRKLQQYRHQGRSSPDLSGVRQAAAYQAIKELHEEHRWPVYKLCAAVGVSKAGYYKWLNRAVSQKQTEDEKLAGLITEIYQAQRGIPGYRQMKIILERRYGLKCNLKRIYRLMRVLGLRSVCRKKKRRYQKKTPAEYTAENILNREFSSDRQNEKWVTDITELKYGSGSKAYLSAGIPSCGEMQMLVTDSRFPDEVDCTLDVEHGSLFELNRLCHACSGFKEQDFVKLGAVCQMAKPTCAANIRQLAENLDQFDFAPNARTPEELGRYMIQRSGYYEYDENLEDFYNYGDYGVKRILQDDGVFMDRGYVSYHGTLTLDELMRSDPAENYQQEQEAKMEGMAW